MSPKLLNTSFPQSHGAGLGRAVGWPVYDINAEEAAEIGNCLLPTVGECIHSYSHHEQLHTI